ncbi:MAG: AAA family ATPase [Pyrinomonadaceae bacterium]
MPDVIVIAGPNGAGKSTFAPTLLRDTFGISEFVNADTIAEGLSAFAPEDASFDAGRVMVGRLNELAGERKDFAFETTLASRFYARWLSALQTSGYRVSMVFLWLDDVDLAIERVRARVRSGGHTIPEDTIIRRHQRGGKNLFELYLPIANSWRVFDASPITPIEIARFTEIDGKTIFHEDLWTKIKR